MTEGEERVWFARWLLKTTITTLPGRSPDAQIAQVREWQAVMARARQVVAKADEPAYTGPPRSTWEALARQRKEAAL